MDAQCPCCHNGCDQCNHTGKIQVGIAEGRDWFTRLCKNSECLFVNGGTACDGYPSISSDPCIVCEGETTWVFWEDPILSSPEVAAEPWIQNEPKLSYKRLNRNLDSLRDSLNKLREFTKNIPGFKDLKLSLEEAQLLRVCRICKEIDNPRIINNIIDPFVLDFGREYAHKSCLQNDNL